MQAPDCSTIHLSVNKLSAPLLQKLVQQANLLQIGIVKHASGCTIIDAGIDHTGSAEAGRMIAEICMGGLGEVRLETDTRFQPPFSNHPCKFQQSCAPLPRYQYGQSPHQ